jgi:hypothetical protein
LKYIQGYYKVAPGKPSHVQEYIVESPPTFLPDVTPKAFEESWNADGRIEMVNANVLES